MKDVCFIAPNLNYFDSYWNMFDTVAQEGKYLASNHAFPKDSTKMFLEHSIEEHVPFRFVLDRATDQIVGWCDAQMCGEKICYLGVGLLAEYRECGIGSRLISEVLSLAKEAGFEKVELDVRVGNTRAIYVYQKLGFHAVRVKKGAFVQDGCVEDVLRMEREL